MGFAFGCKLLRPWLGDNSANPAIIADVAKRWIHHNVLDVNIRHIHVRDVVDGAIIKEISIIPTWVLAPRPGLLWTPGYWGWNDGAYVFHEGYWGPHIGFYGGVAYGFGYSGAGYESGCLPGTQKYS